MATITSLQNTSADKMSSDQLASPSVSSVSQASGNPFEERDPRSRMFFPFPAALASCSSPSPSNAVVSSPWDVERSRFLSGASSHLCRATVTKRSGRILSLALSDNGFLYAGTESTAIRVWRSPGFFEINRLRSSSGVVKALLFASEEGLIFSAHADSKIRVWKSNPFHFRKGTLPSSMECLLNVCWNQPKMTLMKITSASSYSPLRRGEQRPRHDGVITSLSYDSGTSLLYSASSDGALKVWSIREMRCVETVPAHNSSVNALAVVAGSIVFTGSDDGRVKMWRRTPGKRCSHALWFQMDAHGSAVKSLIASGEPGGEGEFFVLYAGCSDGCVRYWKKGSSSGEMAYLGSLKGHSTAVLCLAALESMVVTGSEDASARIWRRSGDGLATHKCVAILSGHKGPVKAVAMAVECELAYVVYSGSLDGSVKQWRVDRDRSGRLV